MTQTLQALSIGVKAHELLGLSDRRWAVLASVSGAIYIESNREEVLWIAGSRSALHGRAILVTHLSSKRPGPGAPCSVRDGHLCIGDDLTVDLGDAAVWRPARTAPSQGGVAEWNSKLADALNRAALQTGSRGFFIHAALAGLTATGSNLHHEMGATLGSAVRKGVAALSQVSSGSGLPDGLEPATGLVGLGEGLTPSGDDFLGGFLFALRVLDRVSPVALGIDWHRVEAWLRRMKPLTNKISFAVLADHARGQAAEPLWAFLRGVLAEASQQQLVQAALRVARIGHTSGWDMLGGVHCGSSVAARMVEGSSQPSNCQYVAAARHGANSYGHCRREVVRVC
jgi:hypothetical protein